MSVGEIGKWNPEKFAAYRSSNGPKRRALASELILENEPLLITLVEQLCGRAKPTPHRKRTAASCLGGCSGFDQIPFEDAMQAARIAFSKMLDQYDPSKGRPAFYALLKIRYELQRLETFELHLARVPRGRESERAGVDLVGEQRDLELLGGGTLGGVIEGCEVSPEDIAEWETTGSWPENLEEALAQKEAKRVYSMPKGAQPVDSAWLALMRRCTFVTVGRADEWGVWNAYRNECRRRDEREKPRGWLLDELIAKGARTTRVRSEGAPVRGFAGLRLRSAEIVC